MDLLQNIDVKQTQEAIDKQLRQYRTYQLTAPEDLLPKITPNYTLEMPVFTGLVNSKTENAAIENVEFEQKAQRFFSKFNRALHRLTKKEREIIVKACLEEYPKFNYEIANELHLSERTFYRIKSKALYTLSLALNVVVYQEDDEAVES